MYGGNGLEGLIYKAINDGAFCTTKKNLNPVRERRAPIARIAIKGRILWKRYIT